MTAARPGKSDWRNEQVVLLFHGLGLPRAELPETEKPYWITLAAFTAIADLVARRRDRGIGREVVITFDDSNLSDLDAAAILAERGLTGEFYLLSERFGLPHYLSRADARALCGRGMTVGSHGHAHLDWRRCDDATLAREVSEARRTIAEAVERPVTKVAIPFGSYDRRVLAALEGEGFERIYNSDGGPARRDDRLVRRDCVMAWHKLGDVEAMLDDRVSLSRRIRRTVAPMVKRLR